MNPFPVSYVRDAADRIVRRAAAHGDQLAVVLWVPTASDDAADLVLDDELGRPQSQPLPLSGARSG